jgi:hypothetical protein
MKIVKTWAALKAYAGLDVATVRAIAPSTRMAI